MTGLHTSSGARPLIWIGHWSAFALGLTALPLPAWTQTVANPASAAPTAICTDRPTKSDNTCTVDPGHFQIEADPVNATFQDTGGVKTDTWLVFNPTMKFGLTPNLDIEVNIASFELAQTQQTPAGGSTVSGVGDLYVRLKYAFLNLDKGAVTADIIPWIKAPTARAGLGNGAVEGGALAPATWKINDAWSLTTEPELDTFKDARDYGRHVATAQRLSLTLSLPENVSLSGEIWSAWNFDPAGEVTQTTADAAVAWIANPRLQFDAGANFGLNRATPSVQVYIGISRKF